MSKLAQYKSRSLMAIQSNKDKVRAVVDTVEIIGGAAAAGALDTKWPDGVMGVPASAAAGLITIGVGLGMGQKDLRALGVGMLAGYAYGQGGRMSAP
jgi:hypothetical protein